MAHSERLIQLLDEMKELYKRKNSGYNGNQPDPFTNFKACQAFGVDPFLGTLVRMADKWGRVCNLAQDAANEQVGESIKDTLSDLAMYALIARCLYEEQEHQASETEQAQQQLGPVNTLALTNAAMCVCGCPPAWRGYNSHFIVHCLGCSLTTAHYATLGRAIEVWNECYSVLRGE